MLTKQNRTYAIFNQNRRQWWNAPKQSWVNERKDATIAQCHKLLKWQGISNAEASLCVIDAFDAESITVTGTISYPSYIGVSYEEATKELVAASIIKHMASIEAYANKKGETKTNSYEMTMDALRHMLGEVITLTGKEQSVDDCKETMIVSRALHDLEQAGYVLREGEDNTRMTAKELTAFFYDICDNMTVITSKREGNEHEQTRSFVLFVQGNGDCVISDYGVSLESVLAGANALAETLE